MKLRHAIPAGLMDASLASLASLAIGAYAARFLPASELGAYALFFSALLVAAVVPSQLVLMPAVIASLAREPIERIGLINQTWRLGQPTGLIAAVLASGAAWLSAEAPQRVLWPLAVTATACSVVSPLQDHVRRTLHLSGTSWRAAVVSLVQVVVVVGALATGRVAGVSDIWLPFGALALANVTSLSFGFLLTRRERRLSALPSYQVRKLMRSGRQLLALELLSTVATFLASTLITRLASPATLGYAEAARIVSQPILLATVGLSAALGPRSMEAGANHNRREASRIARPFVMLLVAIGVLYGALTIVRWWGNPIGVLVPNAYVVPGLVPAAVLAGVLLGIVFPYRSELIGARFLQPLPWLSALAGALQCAAAASAVWIGAFARPVSDATNGLVLWAGYRRYRSQLYPSAPGSPMPDPVKSRHEPDTQLPERIAYHRARHNPDPATRSEEPGDVG